MCGAWYGGELAASCCASPFAQRCLELPQAADIAVDLLGPDIKYHHSKLNFKWSDARPLC